MACVMAVGVLMLSFLGHAIASSVPSIGELLDAPHEDGLEVPGDRRLNDPGLLIDQAAGNVIDPSV